jgi:alpha-beta hydrolase superfamily lysophospholipase
MGGYEMKHEETLWHAKDGTPLVANKWEPDGLVKGVICLVHGHGEHCGRYIHWIEMLTNAGYAVFANDQRGHGKSGGKRGHTPSFNHLADDVEILLKEGIKAYPDLPCFLYGHSLGGLIALYYLTQRRPKIAGAVITSPALKTAVEDQKVKRTLALILGALIPGGAMASGLEQEALSRDSKVVEIYRNDPLVHDQITFGLGRGSLKAAEYIYANADQLDLPILLMHGTADEICYISGVEQLSTLVAGNCTLARWEGCFHELHNEPEKEEVFSTLKQWLDQHAVVKVQT